MKNKEKIKQLEERINRLESIVFKAKEKEFEPNKGYAVVNSFSGFTQDTSLLLYPVRFEEMGYYISLSGSNSKFLLKDLTISYGGTQWRTENTAYRETELQAWVDREKYIQAQKNNK